MTQRSTELEVEVLPAGLGGDLRRQTRQKSFESLRPVAFQEVLILELVYDPLDDLALRHPKYLLAARQRYVHATRVELGCSN